MNLLAQVSSSRQAAAGAVSTAAFFLCEGLLGQNFDVVPDGVAEPQPGDLFLFPLASGGPGWWGAHAGIYCGDGEIIHLEGIVAKHGKSHLLRTRGPAKVLRRKGGLDAVILQRRIRAAMDQAVEYDAVTFNCIHFALALLGLGHLSGAVKLLSLNSLMSDVSPLAQSLPHVSPLVGGQAVVYPRAHPSWRCQQPGSVTNFSEKTPRSSKSSLMSSSYRGREVLEFLLFKSIPEHGKVFEEVLEDELQPGDIVLFPMGNPIGNFKHTGVYCGDGEVIHFQKANLWGKSGLISKEGYKAMVNERGKCKIYRKKGGIDLSDFKTRVRQAMDSEADYSLCSNNCIHFALSLLGLANFYMQLWGHAEPRLLDTIGGH
ncbi:PREDICTED: uncharacterized protein LOC104535960 [Mesitornis unicolor]|uniref:uncharacterized protein LOC104535960 n=1 Tax=Mesitornis unicolor TaxID=54374 RepID=UPI000528A495|nr:PREDICTED: uncharacterized protein LOC104535960 [Mesitornis unicolor]